MIKFWFSFLGPKRTYRLLQTMLSFIKYSDEKINKVEAKMKAIRNMKDTVHKLKKEKDILVKSINKKNLEHKERGSELKAVWTVLRIFL